MGSHHDDFRTFDNLVYYLVMEDTNNITTQEIQSYTPSIQPIPKQNNIFKYLFLICFFILVAVLVSFYFVLNNKNSKLNTAQPKIENDSQLTPTIVASPIVSETMISSTSPDGSVECYQNQKYFVALKDGQSKDSRVLIKLKNSQNSYNDCSYDLEKSDFEIKEWITMVLGLENNFLLTDSGTGPGPRLLTIYDLNKGTTQGTSYLYDGTYDRPFEISNNTITYWEVKSDIANKTNCPILAENESNGFGSIIETHIKLDLITLKKEFLGEDRCTPTQ
jgi:hypothetical protein